MRVKRGDFRMGEFDNKIETVLSFDIFKGWV